MRTRKCARGVWIVFLGAILFAGCHSPRPTTLTISFAASLGDAVAKIEVDYQKGHANTVFRNNAGSSGTLATEIEQGAPVDIFFSASAKPMNELAGKGLLLPDTRLSLLRNELVLIAPKNSLLNSFSGLTDNSVKIIAIGDPAGVPAGEYGEQTLSALHLLDKLRSKFVLAKDVRQVLTYVETGNADAGIVYGTDWRSSAKVRVVESAPANTHDPIVYPVAVVHDSRNLDAARAFVKYLDGPEARAIFLERGFTMVSP